MEFEPLQDTLPNRYAIESDDSEDDVTLNAYPNASKQLRRPKETYSADFVWNEDARTLSGRKTYVAIGQAGLIWASGTALSASEAHLRINEEPVANVYSLSSALEDGGATIVVLQYDLPIGAMHIFASIVLSTLRPKSVVIVDEYSHPAYISSDRIPPLDAPVRYLRTHTSTFKVTTPIKSFRPPNLVLSPSAAFLTILEVDQSKNIPGLLILLPLPHIPHPPPSTMQPIHISVSWPESQINTAHAAIVSSSKWTWDAALAKNAGRLVATKKVKRRLSNSMNMYI